MNVLRLFAFFAVSVVFFPAYAQPAASGDPIVAVVNGEVITQHDLDQKTKLVLLSSNLADAPDMHSRVVSQVLRRMIDEDLKSQAAAKEKITVSSGEVATQLEDLDQQNHLPAGGLVKLLTAKGIEPETLRQQLRTEIAWSKLVGYILARRVHVSESAVETRLDAIKANFGKPEYHAYEIYLSLDEVKNEAQVRDLAERLAEQLRQGAPFEAIARQFNQAGAPDGNLGWVSEGMLDDDLLRALDGLQPNGVTPPIRTQDGYHILTLREKRKVGEGWGSGSTLDLMTIDLNSLASATQAERDLQMQRLRDILAPAKNCDDLTSLSKQAPSAAVNIMQKLPEAQLPAKVGPLIKDLPPGRISDPIDTAKGRRFFAVCGRAAGSSERLPSADDIRHQMEDAQLDLVAQRYLLDLHRNAVIDIRR